MIKLGNSQRNRKNKRKEYSRSSKNNRYKIKYKIKTDLYKHKDHIIIMRYTSI